MTKPKVKRGRGRPVEEKLDPKAPDYYAKLGSRGGNKTKRIHSSAYWANIAKLSHLARRRNKKERLKAEKLKAANV